VIPPPEPGSLTAVAVGCLTFAALVTVGTVAGGGALRLLRFPADPLRRWLLAPFAATMLWALTGNLLVRAGLTLAGAAPAALAVSLALAALGVMSLRTRPRPVMRVLGLALVAGLSIWPLFVRGLTAHLGSGNLDTFHYTTVAAALWRNGLDAPSAPVPFFERYAPHATTLPEGRNHAFVLLGLLSLFVEPGEPMFVRNLFVGWSVFVLACALAYYQLTWPPTRLTGAGSSRLARDRPGAGTPTFLYVVSTVGIGWALVPALVGNWDNALLVAVGPVLAGLAREPAGRVGHGVLLGATLAYAVYAYPELAPFAALFALPLHLVSLTRPRAWRPLLVAHALAAVTAVALLAPGAAPLWRYFRKQLSASGAPAGVRPGGLFADGLVSRSWDLTGWWAFGGEHGRAPDGPGPWACALLLTALLVVGVLRLARHGGRGEALALAMMAASLAYFLGLQRYGYPGYKILSVSAWLVGRGLVEGGAGVLAAAHARRAGGGRAAWRATATTALVALGCVGGLVVSERHRFRLFFPEAFFREQPSLGSLARLRSAAAGQPAVDLLLGRPFDDYVSLPWIYYALKDTALRPYHSAPLQVPGGTVWPSATSSPPGFLAPAGDVVRGRRLFETREYALVDLPSSVIVQGLDSPNGLEAWGTWLGTQPISVSLMAGPALSVALTFEAAPGPSRPESARRRLVLQSGGREVARAEIDRRMRVALPFVTRGGRETITLSTPDPPTVAVLPNGDTRPLLVAIGTLVIAAPSGVSGVTLIK
jgi:hypothetical protein